MAITCRTCGKKTKVIKTIKYREDILKRYRVCVDPLCDSAPFVTYEKRYEKKGQRND